MLTAAPPIRDVVLVGGGHSHVQVLRSFGMKPVPGVRLTVISREVNTPYSGMLPGHVAGFYSREDIHIDLAPLAAFAGARLIADEVVGLDLDAQHLRLGAHPDLYFDVLSVNCGAIPETVGDGALAVKPIGQFLPKLDAVCAAAKPGDRLALVGGGAGGVELALALRRRLPAGVAVSLLTERLLPGHASAVQHRLRQALAAAEVAVEEGFRVAALDGGAVLSEAQRRVAADHVFWVTGVKAPDWPARAGLAVDDRGFIRVNPQLRSCSHPNVFAAGDIACLEDQPRPKAGVYAVRAGPILTTNLRRAATGRALRLIRVSCQALRMWSATAASRPMRKIQRNWLWPRIGAPSSRSPSA